MYCRRSSLRTEKDIKEATHSLIYIAHTPFKHSDSADTMSYEWSRDDRGTSQADIGKLHECRFTPWAIWQALSVPLEKVHGDNAEARSQDPCSVSVVYSDCKQALRWIKKGILKGGKVVQRIIAQSIES